MERIFVPINKHLVECIFVPIHSKKRNVKQFIHLLQEQYTKYGYDITREYYKYIYNKLGMQGYIYNDNNTSMYTYMIIYDYNIHI